jgi:hypothetical protein
MSTAAEVSLQLFNSSFYYLQLPIKKCGLQGERLTRPQHLQNRQNHSGDSRCRSADTVSRS